MAAHRNHMGPREVLSSKGTVFDEVGDDGIRSIGKIITVEEFMQVPRGIGGRVGVIPWFIANVVGTDGERRVTPMVRLCVTNNLYLSDIGGGIRANTDAYSGLYKELQEETPTWKDEILIQLRHPRTIFLALEQYKVRPAAKRPVPLQFLVFVYVMVDRLDHVPFQPTSEIRATFDRTLDQFHTIVDHRPNIGSLGIRMYHLFRQHAKLGDTITSLFRGRVQDIEYQEADLVDEKVEVVLANGVSTASFQELARNNSNFSKNLNKAWLKRKEYVSQQMSRKSVPSVKSNHKIDNGITIIRNNWTRKRRHRRHGHSKKRWGKLFPSNRIEIMGNSPSASSAPASSAPASSAPVPVPAASLSANSKKNNSKTVVQVPAENVTITKGGKRRRLRGGVASVQFDLVPRLQPSDAVMERVTSAPVGLLRGGRRTRRRSSKRSHTRRRSRR